MKITFMGAGSTVFTKNVLGDTMLCETFHDAEIALYDIDGKRLEESFVLIEKLNETMVRVVGYKGPLKVIVIFKYHDDEACGVDGVLRADAKANG